MNGATQTLNELLAPVMNILGVQDAWIIVACVAAFLFLLFFILFISRCIKIGRLKAVIREKDVEITGLATAAKKHQSPGQDGEVSSVVYARPESAAVAASLTGEVNPYAKVSGEDGAGSDGSFDDAWRSENTQFLEKCETGVVFQSGSQEARHFTDVIFGGRSGEDGISYIGEAADPGQRRRARQAEQEIAERVEETEYIAPSPEQSMRMDQIRGMDLESKEQEQTLFPEEAEAEQAKPSSGRSSGLSSKIPHL